MCDLFLLFALDHYVSRPFQSCFHEIVIIMIGTDLMETIHEDDEVPDLSENSDSEDEAQPKKNRVARRTKKDFETGFNFVSSQKEYMTDTWNDLSKYIKKQAKTNLDDKIAQVRQERAGKKATGSGGKESAITLKDSDSESDESLSDDEMVRDNIKVGLTSRIVLAKKSRTVQEIGWLEFCFKLKVAFGVFDLSS